VYCFGPGCVGHVFIGRTTGVATGGVGWGVGVGGVGDVFIGTTGGVFIGRTTGGVATGGVGWGVGVGGVGGEVGWGVGVGIGGWGGVGSRPSSPTQANGGGFEAIIGAGRGFDVTIGTGGGWRTNGGFELTNGWFEGIICWRTDGGFGIWNWGSNWPQPHSFTYSQSPSVPLSLQSLSVSLSL
jgi:hypothetical protein